MFNFFASSFMAVGMFFSSMFGGHASTTAQISANGHYQNGTSSGQWMASSTNPHGMARKGMIVQGIFGTVLSINGNTLEVSGRYGTSTATSTYSVDATNARILKGSATSTASISAIAVGDTVAIQGPLSGTSITATSVFDGKFMTRGPGMKGMGGMQNGANGGRRMPGGAPVNVNVSGSVSAGIK